MARNLILTGLVALTAAAGPHAATTTYHGHSFQAYVTLCPPGSSFVTIHWITRNRYTQPGQMHSDLVRSARLGRN